MYVGIDIVKIALCVLYCLLKEYNISVHSELVLYSSIVAEKVVLKAIKSHSIVLQNMVIQSKDNVGCTLNLLW